MAKHTLKPFTAERFQQEVAQELGIDLSQSGAPTRARREPQSEPVPAQAPKQSDRQE